MTAPDAVGTANLHGHAPRITIYLKVTDELVKSISFSADGCGVVIAAGSMLTELAASKSLAECQLLTVNQLVAALGGLPRDKRYCAELTMKAFRNALANVRR